MALSKSLASYTDVKAILDACVRAGGGRYRLETAGRATQWRHRANAYRNLLRKQHQVVESIVPPTPYDHLIFRIYKEDPTVVVIEVNAPTGQLEGFDGKPLDTTVTAEVQLESTDDPLLEEALAFAAGLDLGD